MPGRPERDETIEYYFSYIDQVPDGDIRAILEEQGREAHSFLASLPESLADHRYAPDKWTVREVVSHINDCERLYTMRAFWFAREMEAPLPSFEPELALKTARPADRTLASHVHELASIRAATLDLFSNLSSVAWLRRGVASGYPFSVRAMAYIAAGHVTHHTRILRERYL